MSLRTTLTRQASQIRHYRDFPAWWTILQVGLGVVFVLFVGYQLIAPEPEANTYNEYLAANPYDGGTLDEPNAGPDAVVPDSEPATSGPTTSLEMQDGSGDVSVPEEALTVAEAAAAALFTTDFTGVPLSEGAVLPTLPQRFENPFVSKPVLVSVSRNLIVFAFAVDPDSPQGPEGPRRINVTVASDGGPWGYTGG